MYCIKCKYYWKHAPGEGGNLNSFKYRDFHDFDCLDNVLIYQHSCLRSILNHLTEFCRLFRLNILCCSRAACPVSGPFFPPPCPPLEPCAVSFVTARSAGFEPGRCEQSELFCWHGEVQLLISWQCSDSGVICSNAYSQLPSVIKLTQAVNLWDKVCQFHLQEMFLIPFNVEFCKSVSSPISPISLWSWQYFSDY